MKEIRIFVASSKELLPERNALAYFVLAHEDEFAKRGLRVRLSKWEYVDPTMTEERTENRYLEEMLDSDGVLVLFKTVLGKYTKEELDCAVRHETDGDSFIKAHRILFKECKDVPSESLVLWRAQLHPDEFGCYATYSELEVEFLAFVDRISSMELREVPPDVGVHHITAFLAADEELQEDRNAFADTVLSLNDLLERRKLRVKLSFCNSGLSREMLENCISSSEMGLVLYGSNVRAFGRSDMENAYGRTCRGENPKKLYVFFREEPGQELSPEFRAFRDSFADKLGHFICQFGGADTLRLSFLLSVERFAGENVEIYSTLCAPTTSVFVGREEELRRLHELLTPIPGKMPAGRLPIITGGGGVGKSELVRQFASQFRVQYPGGIFQADMEHVRSWSEVFSALLRGCPNNGVSAREYLGLPSSEEEGENDSGKIRAALMKRARDSGPILVVLDNVEDFEPLIGRDGGFAQAFPSGFSERVHINILATARVCNRTLRPTDWAVSFPVGDLSPAASLELLLMDHPATGDERKAAERVAKILGYRALFLRRVPALIGNLDSEVICDTYTELESELERNLTGTIDASETGELYLPAALWKMTCERIAVGPLGQQCIRLAEVASFFSPDGFRQDILKCLWNKVVAPETCDERKFSRVVEILRRHNVFQSIDPVRLHRLDRAAILKTAEQESDLEDKVAEALAVSDVLALPEWKTLVCRKNICKHLPPEVLANVDFLLNVHHDLPNNYIPWHDIKGDVWCKLLRVEPQLSNLCPWDCLTGTDWGELLCYQPQFAEKCLWKKLGGRDWGLLLAFQPQFAEKCAWESLDSRAWATLIRNQPQFSDRCPWGELTAEDKKWIVSKQQQFEGVCSSLDVTVCVPTTYLERKVDAAQIGNFVKRGYSDLQARLLAQRGVVPEEAEDYLAPSLEMIVPVAALPGVKAVVDQIMVNLPRRIVVFGDYDCDGVSATAIMVRVLRMLNADVRAFIPLRADEGYGMSECSVDRMLKENPGVSLVIAVDNGINSAHQISRLKESGVDVVIIDHHKASSTIPNVPIANPLLSAPVSLRNLCGAAVSFWVARALLEEADRPGTQHDDIEKKLLVLAGLATITDVMPLSFQNRILVSLSLQNFYSWAPVGLIELYQQVRGQIGRNGNLETLSAKDFGFLLGPRINAVGSLGAAETAVQLLLTDDHEEAKELAMRVDACNAERKALDQQMSATAKEQLKSQINAGAWFVSLPEGHTGVAGIVAARLLDRRTDKGVPVCVFVGGRGSIRAPKDYDVRLALQASCSTIDSYGGGAEAAGVFVEDRLMDDFKKMFERACSIQSEIHRLSGTVAENSPERIEYVDAEVSVAELTVDFCQWLKKLEPCFEDNPSPKFKIKGTSISSARAIGKDGRHLLVSFGDDSPSAVWMWHGDRVEELADNALTYDAIVDPQVISGENPYVNLRIVDLVQN